jgi:hypothetical protein
MPGQGSVEFAGCRGLALQQRDGTGQGRPVTTGDAGGKFRRVDP